LKGGISIPCAEVLCLIVLAVSKNNHACLKKSVRMAKKPAKGRYEFFMNEFFSKNGKTRFSQMYFFRMMSPARLGPDDKSRRVRPSRLGFVRLAAKQFIK